MLVGIVSDTHNNYPLVAKATEILREREVDCVLHCGDIEDAAVVELFRGLETHFVFGNCDTDQKSLREAIAAANQTLHESFGTLTLAGTKIAWLHGHDIVLFRDVERSEFFDFVFYGHTHLAEERRTGKTRVVNPGALFRARVKTFCILELPACKLERVEVS